MDGRPLLITALLQQRADPNDRTSKGKLEDGHGCIVLAKLEYQNPVEEQLKPLDLSAFSCTD